MAHPEQNQSTAWVAAQDNLTGGIHAA